MPDIPESLLRRSAEAKAKALGLPVEQVLAEMRGEAPLPKPAPAEKPAVEEAPASVPEASVEAPASEPEPAETDADVAPAVAPATAATSGSIDELLAAAAAAGGLPESLVKRSAEAKAKALGVPVEQVLAEMAGDAAPAAAPAASAAPAPAPAPEPHVETPSEPVPAPASAPAAGLDELLAAAAAAGGLPENLVKRSAEAKAKALGVPVEQVLAEMAGQPAPPAAASPPPPAAEPAPAATPAPAAAPAPARETPAPPPAEAPAPTPGAGRVAAVVSPRPLAPPANAPDGVRTQRLLTVVKAKAIQQVKTEPTDKVNTWPHLLLIEFVALLGMTALLLILSTILQAPLLEPANFNATPNPSKAPWYFLGLQELLSYFDPQIAGVTVPTIVGLIGFMLIPYVDRNPSTKPSDRKFAIMLYTIFLTGSATLTILGVLFRGKGFNFAYPWRDGIFFDDLKDWVNFE